MINPRESLTRRQVAARLGAVGLGVLAVPILGERGHLSANGDEDKLEKTEERRIIIPHPETVEDHMRVFADIVSEEMNSKALENLGLTGLLTPEAMSKKYDNGEFIPYGVKTRAIEKSSKPGEFDYITSSSYKLIVDNTAYPFSAAYIYNEANLDFIEHGIRFYIGKDGKLRQMDDTNPLSQDELKSFGDTYFNFTDTLGWPSFPGPDSSEGIIGGAEEEKNGLRKDYGAWLFTDGTVMYASGLKDIKTDKDNQNL